MVWMSNTNPACRTTEAETFFQQHFRREDAATWSDLARCIVDRVCGARLGRADRDQLVQYIAEMKLMPSPTMLRGTRAGMRPPPAAVVLEADGETPGKSGRLATQAWPALDAGSRLAVDYSRLPAGRVTPAMHVVNEMGRAALASGAMGPLLPGRPTSIVASLAASHPDLGAFVGAGGEKHPRGSATALARLGPFDLTERRVRFETSWFLDWVSTGEPGQDLLTTLEAAMAGGNVSLGFDLFERGGRGPARLSAADVNLSRIESASELAAVTQLATQFLLCDAAGPAGADPDSGANRDNPGLALGLMGLHEWFLRRGAHYEASSELGRWLEVWRGASQETAAWFSDALCMRRVPACRAVNSNRVLARLAGTTAGIEPLSAVAYRSADTAGVKVHPLADWLSDDCGIGLDTMESGLSLSGEIGRSLAVHAQVQAATDMAVSTSIRLPAWETPGNGPERVGETARILAAHAHLLRGVAFEPEGTFGRQPRTATEPPPKRERARQAA